MVNEGFDESKSESGREFVGGREGGGRRDGSGESFVENHCSA